MWGAVAERLGQHLQPKTRRLSYNGALPKRAKCRVEKSSVLVGKMLRRVAVCNVSAQYEGGMLA